MKHSDFTTGTRFFQSDPKHPDYNKIQIVQKVDVDYVYTNLRPDGFGINSPYAQDCLKT